jgi:branched-subunit amino acid aminotransferase/4-amino-4-deoxychorismate lyase
VLRLARDTRALGLPAPEPGLVARAFAELARAAFGAAEGIVRLHAFPDPATGSLRLLGTPRPVGPEPQIWSAIRAPVVHPGPDPASAAKRHGVLFYDEARDAARAAGVDDTLLFDAEDRLVEGARTNAIVALAGGALVTPPLSRGAVAGLAREILLGRVLELSERDVSSAELAQASELVLCNAVRGARPVARIDDRVIRVSAPGPVAARLAATLADADRDDC